jgi:folate-binding protein YgfZ
MDVDLSDWAHVRITGDDRVRFVHGLTTINVEVMRAGDQRWGAILNPKGRVLSVIQLERRAEDLVVHCEGVLGDKTQGILERYAVMDDVAFERVTGPAHRVWTTPATAWEAPVVMGAAAAPASAEEVEAFRVVAGVMKYGVDVDEDHFPFETPLGRFLDYEKGCYVGQEPVFRVRSQGNAARALRGLVLAEDAEVAAGAGVSHASRAKAGTVTSVARSPRWGHVAMAYLHRSVFEVGGTVEVGGKAARVTDFPIAD